ncbi:MAG: hypothetical protein [Wendovervirus sonii]|uniref:Uncharacterized protein n=1 Tax=phage Lak_Megaphage_Sonny TaxID=3109229 RepID=A0ABZ0Z6M4_9CAUD|nr:MAG: hypothetical protein [phage Lak_Megaphage_Sonny]
MNKKQLYESIMRSVSKEVKKVLNERYNRPCTSTVNIKVDVENYDLEIYLEDVLLNVELYCDSRFAGSQYSPTEEPSVSMEDVSFDESKYTDIEQDEIKKYIDDNWNDIENLAYDAYMQELDDMEAARDDDRYKCWKESQI